MGLYGSPQIGYHASGRPPRRRFRWLKVLLIIVGSIIGGFIALVVGLAILIATHVIPEPATSTSTPTPQACSPSPCASSRGLVLVVSAVDRNWQPPPPTKSYETKPTPKPGFHFVRLQVAFQDQSGEHHVNPDVLQLEDSLGYSQGASVSYEDYCGSVFGSSTTLAPGGSTQPVWLCYEAGGRVDGKLTLIWTPDASKIGDQCFVQQPQLAVVDCSQVTVRVPLP